MRKVRKVALQLASALDFCALCQERRYRTATYGMKDQLDAERAAVLPPGTLFPPESGGDSPGQPPRGKPEGVPAAAAKPKRFHGAITLDTARVGRDAGKIAEETIQQAYARIVKFKSMY